MPPAALLCLLSCESCLLAPPYFSRRLPLRATASAALSPLSPLTALLGKVVLTVVVIEVLPAARLCCWRRAGSRGGGRFVVRHSPNLHPQGVGV